MLQSCIHADATTPASGSSGSVASRSDHMTPWGVGPSSLGAPAPLRPWPARCLVQLATLVPKPRSPHQQTRNDSRSGEDSGGVTFNIVTLPRKQQRCRCVRFGKTRVPVASFTQ